MRQIPLLLVVLLALVLSNCASSPYGSSAPRVYTGATDYYEPSRKSITQTERRYGDNYDPVRHNYAYGSPRRSTSSDLGSSQPYSSSYGNSYSSSSYRRPGSTYSSGIDYSPNDYSLRSSRPGSIYSTNGTSSRRIGNTWYHSNGTSSRMIGSSIYNSDGSSSRIIGSSIYNSDGSSSRRIGNSWHHSDGTSSRTW